jgi:hypothetical protein
MKPIATLMRPLGTVEIPTGEAASAVAERSDVTAVPAMGVIAEAMVAFVLAHAWLEKFGGDSLRETRHNVEGYLARVAQRVGNGRLASAPGQPDGRGAGGAASAGGGGIASPVVEADGTGRS